MLSKTRRSLTFPELKCFDGTVPPWQSLTNIGYQPFGGTLLAISEGTDDSSRIGEHIMISKVYIRLMFNMNEENPAFAYDVVRVMVVLDKQANGAPINEVDLLGTAYGPLKFLNTDNAKRFRVLYDESVILKANGAAALNPPGTPLVARDVEVLDIYLDHLNIHTRYNDPMGSITSITSNNIAVIMLPQGNNRTRFYGEFRVRYTEL